MKTWRIIWAITCALLTIIATAGMLLIWKTNGCTHNELAVGVAVYALFAAFFWNLLDRNIRNN